MVDLYNRERDYQRIKATIPSWNCPEENKKHVLAYLKSQIEHNSPGRKYSDLGLLKQIFYGTHAPKTGALRRSALITKPLEKMTIADFEEVRDRMHATVMSKEAWQKVKRHIKGIMLDRFQDDPAKREVIDKLFLTGARDFFKWQKRELINTSLKPESYYTKDEFLRLLKACRRPQERALLALAWESTSRPNEYLSLNVGDVEELTNGFKILAHISKSRSGETTTRPLYVLVFRADFAAFWNTHLFRDNPSAPLFYREDCQEHRGKRLGPAGANKMLKQADKRSGIKKAGTLYFLRHGGYSWKRKEGMNTALAARDMGWSPGSKQEKRYLHIADEDVLNERLRLAGEHHKNLPQEKLRARNCPWCNQTNSPSSIRCESCGQTLNVEEIMDEVREQRELLQVMEDKFEEFSKLMEAMKGNEPLTVALSMIAKNAPAGVRPPARAEDTNGISIDAPRGKKQRQT